MTDASPEEFGRYVTDAARAAGYDIDSPRGGGRKALAEAAGLSAASVSRTLNGVSIPELGSFRAPARALEVGTEDLLRVAGVLGGEAPEPPQRTLAIAEAARRLGVRQPRHVAALEVVVAAMLRAEEVGTDPA